MEKKHSSNATCEDQWVPRSSHVPSKDDEGGAKVGDTFYMPPIPRLVSDVPLRDWYAGQALVGLLANPSIAPLTKPEIARRAVHMADAMLAARNPAGE